MPQSILAVVQQAGIACARSGATGFLKFLIGPIREAQDEMAEALIEFLFLGEQLEAGTLRSLRWLQTHTAITYKYSSGHSALDRRYKTDCARAQVERGCIALEIKVVYTDRLAAKTQVPQLLVGRIRIRRRRNRGLDGVSNKRKRE